MQDFRRWQAQAQRVTITRDDWGIAHVRGRSDADAVFGMIYAQAEDDFPRIEANYLTALGRTAEADGERAIWQDLRARLYVSEAELKAHYAASPTWLQQLMNGWADGLNYYLARHPQVRPRVLTWFEPWMALSFTEGSIGGDIERIDLEALEAFYSRRHPGGEPGFASSSVFQGRRMPAHARHDGRFDDNDPRGSNGIAIAPVLTSAGRALLLINPHTSFFFRSEQQVTSEQGLNAYGAATWGQFFIYQGFNDRAGWMHTSSGVDSVDEFIVDLSFPELGPRYRYGQSWRELELRPVTIRYRSADGRLASRSFTTWRTHRGPIVRSDQAGRWVAFAMMDRPVAALQQSFLRTKAKDLGQFVRVAQLQANSSNATLFADSGGAIAYLHPQFVPRRDNRFDYTKPVALTPASDWSGVHPAGELPNSVRPPNGWVQNTNNHPWSAAGLSSPKAHAYPRYMDSYGENPRGVHAVRLLSGREGWTLERLQAAAYSDRQPGFDLLLPSLLRAWAELRAADPLKQRLRKPVAALQGWNRRWSAASVPNTVANFWGEELWKLVTTPEWDDSLPVYRRLEQTTPRQKLAALDAAIGRLQQNFGRWDVPWGEINRFQRISPAIDHPFSDRRPSIAVPFGSGRWGSLASFGAAAKPGTKRWYGTGGNSFVAVVEFGPRVLARAITAGGASGNPASPHFNDQAGRYAAGALREVYFHPDQLRAHTAKVYRP
ncbi:MAG TPA: penicillin acylase family protein [Sphingomicrobium sp.]|nr:penicillin acylase family protein [Sphingomicrobium sp.]